MDDQAVSHVAPNPQNDPAHPGVSGSISHSSKGLNLFSTSLRLGSALKPRSFKGPSPANL